MTDTTDAPVKLRAMAINSGTTLKVLVRGLPERRVRCGLGIAVLRVSTWLLGVGLDVALIPRCDHSARSMVFDGLPRRLRREEYRRDRHGEIEVTLDGVPQKDAVGYDVDAGTVTRARLDGAGGLIVVGDRIMHETVEGILVVRRPQP